VENHLNQVDLVVDHSMDYFPLLLYSMLLVNEVYQDPMMNVLMVVVVSMNVQVKNQVAVVWVVLMGLMDVFDLLMVDFH
jgi:hypothetical protein